MPRPTSTKPSVRYTITVLFISLCLLAPFVAAQATRRTTIIAVSTTTTVVTSSLPSPSTAPSPVSDASQTAGTDSPDTIRGFPKVALYFACAIAGLLALIGLGAVIKCTTQNASNKREKNSYAMYLQSIGENPERKNGKSPAPPAVSDPQANLNRQPSFPQLNGAGPGGPPGGPPGFKPQPGAYQGEQQPGFPPQQTGAYGAAGSQVGYAASPQAAYAPSPQAAYATSPQTGLAPGPPQPGPGGYTRRPTVGGELYDGGSQVSAGSGGPRGGGGGYDRQYDRQYR